MKLWSYWRSSASWRVRIALHYKGIPFTDAAVHLVRDGGQQRAPEHLARNPMAQVPVLRIGDEANGVLLTQSLAIIEYLDEVYPSPSLVPGSALLRAKARQLAEIVNSGIQPLQNLSLLQVLEKNYSVDKTTWARSVIETGLNALEQTAQESAGRYLVGARPSIADICLIPQLYNARRFGCSMNWPTLLRVENNCEQLLAFQAAHPDQQPDAPAMLAVA